MHPSLREFDWLLETKLIRKIGEWYEIQRPSREEVGQFAHAMIVLGIWARPTPSGAVWVEYQRGEAGTLHIRVNANGVKGAGL